jgi:hypothetical protein
MVKKRLHIWREERNLSGYIKHEYDRIIAPVTRTLDFSSNPWIIDVYSKTVHGEMHRFGKDDIGKPYFRTIGVYARTRGNPEDQWDNVCSNCWGMAGILPAQRGLLERAIASRMRREIAETRELEAETITRNRKGPEEYVAWVNKGFIEAVEVAAKKSGFQVVKQNY